MESEILKEEISEGAMLLRENLAEGRENVPTMVKSMMGGQIDNFASSFDNVINLIELLNQRISEVENARHD